MIKKKFGKYSLTMLLLVGILLITLVGGVSFAWFADTTGEVMNLNTSVIGSYFERGDGSKEKPFVIARPLQLYYFSWLQNLGYFNQEFDESGNVKQYYFELSDEYYVDTGAINMEDFCLPPIGTVEKPFLGHFDGKGVVISNLTVQNRTEDLTDNPTNGGYQIIGFFGVVGAYGNPSYSYSSEVNEVTNFGLDNVTIRSDAPTDNKTLIGIAAGYVNGKVSDVAVCNPTIAVASGVGTIEENNFLSKYYVVGFCEENFKDKLSLTYVDVSAPKVETTMSTTSGDGTENAWGGSIAMQSIYQRLLNIYNNRTNRNNEADTPFFCETITNFRDENGELIDSQETGKTTYYSLQDSNNGNRVGTFPGTISGDNDIGRFSFLSTNPGNVNAQGYTYLHGKITQKTEIRFNQSAFDGYLITDDNGNFLSASGTSVVNATSGKDAALWRFDTEKHLYTVIGGTTYYLTRNADDSLSLSTMANTVWTNDKAGSISCNVGNDNHNLVFNSGWKTVAATEANGTVTVAYGMSRTVSGESDGYMITDGKGHYLSADGTTVVNNAPPSLWKFDNAGRLFTVSNGTTYYLAFNSNDQSLYLTENTSTTWTNDGKGSVYCVYNGRNYYLSYLADLNGWQAIYDGQTIDVLEYTISYSSGNTTNYLSINNNGTIVNQTSANQATRWTFSDTNNENYPQGKISATVGDKTYYLTLTSSGGFWNPTYTLGLTDDAESATEFTYTLISETNGSLSTRFNYRLCYLSFNGEWIGSGTETELTTSRISTTISIPLQTISAINVIKTVENVADDDATWFPLSVVNSESFSTDNYRAAKNNTGYIIGGSQDTSGSSVARLGDIRVSSYPIGDLSTSVTNNTLNTVYTQARGIDLKGYSTSADTATLDKLQKYKDAVGSFSTLLTARYVYGLHFMNATIGTDRLVNAEKVTFDHVSYYDFKMPMSAIDFTLPSNGYINFFAGTYFSGNNAFFSLHEIFRAKSVLSKEAIVMAYDYNGTIIFKCSDGSYREYKTDAEGNYKYEKISRPNDFDAEATQKFRFVYMNPTNLSAPLYYYDGTNYSTLANGTFTQVTALPEGYVDVNEITAIKEIKKVYGKLATNGAISAKSDFVYLFSDNTYSSTLPADYELVFDLEWITNPSSIRDNAVYYYEVPANAGEYALGSVDGKIGAYLLYLDLSSNAQKVNRTEITTITQITEEDYEFPTGVQLVDTIPANTDQLTVTPSDSVCLQLSPDFAGKDLALARANGTDTDTITLTSGGATPTAEQAAGAGISASYIGDGITTDPTLSITPKETRIVKTIKTVQRIDLNVATNEETITYITTTVYSDGRREFTVTDENGTPIDNPNIVDDGNPITMTDTRSLSFHTTVDSDYLNTSIKYTAERAETSMEVDKDTKLTMNFVAQNTSGAAANATVDDVTTDWTLTANSTDTTVSGHMTVQLNGTDATVGAAIELTATSTPTE